MTQMTMIQAINDAMKIALENDSKVLLFGEDVGKNGGVFRATEVIDNEVKEARLKEEWKAEYMLTLVHDKDVYRDGYDEGAESRQPEVDALNVSIKERDEKLKESAEKIREKDAELEKFKSLLIANGIEIDK